jgi:hypothetical protein
VFWRIDLTERGVILGVFDKTIVKVVRVIDCIKITEEIEEARTVKSCLLGGVFWSWWVRGDGLR